MSDYPIQAPRGSLFAQPKPEDNYLDAFFDAANPGVYWAFKVHAITLRSAGTKHYSARAIVTELRHHSAVRDGSGLFKLNDHLSPTLARRLVREMPEFKSWFEFRERKSA